MYDLEDRQAEVQVFLGIGGNRGLLWEQDVRALLRMSAAPHPARQFRSLVEGVAELHHLGITHRDISPGSIDVFDGLQLKLARFELSALITDLFRQLWTAARMPTTSGTLLTRRSDRLAYAAPERVAFLLCGDVNLVENERSDVYSLAAVVWEWFAARSPPTCVRGPSRPSLCPAGGAGQVRALRSSRGTAQ